MGVVALPTRPIRERTKKEERDRGRYHDQGCSCTDEGNEGDEGTTRGDKEVALRRTHLFECPPTTSVGMNALFDASHRLHTLLQEEKHGEQCDVDSLVFLHTCESLC